MFLLFFLIPAFLFLVFYFIYCLKEETNKVKIKSKKYNQQYITFKKFLDSDFAQIIINLKEEDSRYEG